MQVHSPPLQSHASVQSVERCTFALQWLDTHWLGAWLRTHVAHDGC